MQNKSNRQKFSLTAAIYYYFAMLISLVVFFAGVNLAAHGLLRATTQHSPLITNCLTPDELRTIDPARISAEQQSCAKTEQGLQERQGYFQVGQGLIMALIAVFIFGWHFKHIRELEMQLKKDSGSNDHRIDHPN